MKLPESDVEETGDKETEEKGAKKDVAAEEAGEAEAAAPSPDSDPRFQGVVKRLGSQAKKEKTHAPAAQKVNEARGAAVAPANDRSSRAQANQVAVMDKQEAKKPDKNDFLTMLREELKRIMPNNMEETLEFKKKGKAGKLKKNLTGKVNQQKAASTKDIEGATKAKPDPKSVPEKEVVDMPEEAPDKRPSNLRSKDVLPLPKADEDISGRGQQEESRGPHG